MLTTRTQIAEALWNHTNEDYTDWALDQAIKRLRSKLVRFAKKHQHFLSAMDSNTDSEGIYRLNQDDLVLFQQAT